MKFLVLVIARFGWFGTQHTCAGRNLHCSQAIFRTRRIKFGINFHRAVRHNKRCLHRHRIVNLYIGGIFSGCCNRPSAKTPLFVNSCRQHHCFASFYIRRRCYANRSTGGYFCYLYIVRQNGVIVIVVATRLKRYKCSHNQPCACGATLYFRFKHNVWNFN